MLREKNVNTACHLLTQIDIKRNLYKQLNYIIDMRIFQTLLFDDIIVLTDCTEEDVYDTKGAYAFTLVVGWDEDGNEQKIPKDIEVTFNELNL